MFSFSTGPRWYHVFRAGAGRTHEKCNRHKISTADHASREFPLSPAIVGQTESFKIFKLEALLEATFDHLEIAQFCPEKENIDVITMSKVANELWINYCSVEKDS